MSEPTLLLSGRVLYLTRDPALIARQLNGEDLTFDPDLPLLDDVSTDEIAPAWACYHFDQTLGQYAYAGLRGGSIGPGDLLRGGFSVVVSGRGRGAGSSREAAPFAELAAGVRLVVARSIEKIYAQNCQNIGLSTTTDFSVLERVVRRQPISREAFVAGLDPISRDVVLEGGLFAYNQKRLRGELRPPPMAAEPRRGLTLCEKIIAAHAVVDARSGGVGVPSVTPGDALFVRADVRFSHDYVTAMAEALFHRGFGPDAALAEPESLFLFRDHLTLLDTVMPDEHRRLGLLDQASLLARAQAAFAQRHGVRLFGEVSSPGRGPGSEAICHNKVLEDIALPGQLVVGTDSHTCMAGALGCLAFGIGSTDMANAFRTRDVRIKVPESIRVVLSGSLRRGVCAKDVMLELLGRSDFKAGRALGKVLEFTGPGLVELSLDERATLANMSVEAGAFTGIAAPDAVVRRYLKERRGSLDSMSELSADCDAEYAGEVEIDLAAIEPMVALPGDPKNGVPLSTLPDDLRIDLAYGGSCTGSKQADMDMYALVLDTALARGQRVHPAVRFYIQFGSQDIRRYAERRGYIDVFRRAGAELLEPACGACIRAGPGVSSRADQVTISAANRNFPGRSGPGKVYLASPLVVAASAVAGTISAPRIERREPGAES